MKAFRSLIALCLATAFAGCAVTPADLRADAEARRAFTVKASYQEVLRRIEHYNAECTTVVAIPIGGDGINQVRNYADLRQATIVRGSAALGVPAFHQIIELREAVPGTTEVIVFAKLQPQRVAYVYEQVARGANSGCVRYPG